MDLSDDLAEREALSKFSEHIRTKFRMEWGSDNFENRSIANIVANSYVTVGVLTAKNRSMIQK